MNRVMRGPESYRRALHELCDYVEASGKLLVEVGSFGGESAVEFAKHFSKVVCVDLWSGTCARWKLEEVEKWFDERTRNLENVVKLKMDSADAARMFEDERVDVVYIDTFHDYASVRRDIESWIRTIRDGGFITGHDYGGEWPDVKTAVDELLGAPDRVFEDTSWVKQL